jgi:hypothetical protein
MARWAVARRNECLDSFTGNANSGLLRIYSGTRPTNADTALSGNTLLATLTMNATSFAAASAGVLTANAITSDSSADATGTASFVRLLESDGTTAIGDFGVTTGSPADGTEVQLSTLSVVSGQPVSCSAFTLTFAVGS